MRYAGESGAHVRPGFDVLAPLPPPLLELLNHGEGGGDDQVLDNVLLLDVDPARERQEQDSERVGFGRHAPIVATR